MDVVSDTPRFRLLVEFVIELIHLRIVTITDIFDYKFVSLLVVDQDSYSIVEHFAINDFEISLLERQLTFFDTFYAIRIIQIVFAISIHDKK